MGTILMHQGLRVHLFAMPVFQLPNPQSPRPLILCRNSQILWATRIPNSRTLRHALHPFVCSVRKFRKALLDMHGFERITAAGRARPGGRGVRTQPPAEAFDVHVRSASHGVHHEVGNDFLSYKSGKRLHESSELSRPSNCNPQGGRQEGRDPRGRLRY
jgi:hypothetical protein